MAKGLRTLSIALAAAFIAAGGAWAGPGGSNNDSGDPDIPNSPLKRVRAPASNGMSTQPVGASAEVASRAIGDEREELWIRLFRAYLRLVRVVGP